MYSSTWQNSSFSSNHDYNLVQPCPSIRFYLFLPKDLLFQSRERVSMAGAICNATTRRGQLARCSQMGRRCSALSLLWAGSLGSFPPPQFPCPWGCGSDGSGAAAAAWSRHLPSAPSPAAAPALEDGMVIWDFSSPPFSLKITTLSVIPKRIHVSGTRRTILAPSEQFSCPFHSHTHTHTRYIFLFHIDESLATLQGAAASRMPAARAHSALIVTIKGVCRHCQMFWGGASITPSGEPLT